MFSTSNIPVTSMPNNINSSIEKIPVELFHRIFDNLNTETILFSMRPVCRLFLSVVHTYNRFILDFKLISKSNFNILCRLINPKNVISLTLSNKKPTLNQIDLFISLVHLRQFTRLHSITLHDIDEGQLNCILKQIKVNTLTSFSFRIRKYDDRRKKTTINLLSSIIAQSTLRKFEFYINDERLSKISWPINCTIQYLTINDLKIDDFSRILQCSPYLHIIIMSSIPRGMTNNLTSICFRQLTSLTIKDFFGTIDVLESFLLLTPSLTYLKFIKGQNMLDGKRWEQFISINLSQLETFEFYFNKSILNQQTLIDLDLIIDKFRTPFWIEYKKWFVTCEYEFPMRKTISVYTIPVCQSFMNYVPKSERNSLSTYPMMMDNDSSIINNINSLKLTLNKLLAKDIQEKEATGNHPSFPKVTEIDLQFDEGWPLFALQSLSMFIDISRLVSITMDLYNIHQHNENRWIDIGIFMEQACNLSSLFISGRFYAYQPRQTIVNICSIIPRHVKHLILPINDLVQLKIILERCENLATITVNIKGTQVYRQIINWFVDNTVNSTCKQGYECVTVWLGNKNIQSTETAVDYKRMKLTENDLDS